MTDKEKHELLKETKVETGKGSKWNPETEKCEFQNSSWCDLPKYKHCKFCIRTVQGDKACGLQV